MTNLDLHLMVKCLAQTLHMGVHQFNYKDGAFKAQVAPDTPPLDTLDMFIASHLLTEKEKATVRATRSALNEYQRGEWAGLRQLDILSRMMPMEEITHLFDKDAKRQGIYVPPTMAQTYDPASQRVTSTTTIDSEGNVQHTPGGQAGVVPGAPASFNSTSSASAAQTLGKKPSDTDANRQGAANDPSKPKDRNVNYGAEFEKKMRGAFR